MARQLTNLELRDVRPKLCAKQDWTCPLCMKSLRDKQPVIDHCHNTGYIRGVLCRNCNGLEGKVKTASIRAVGTEEYINWLTNLVTYLKHHQCTQGNLLHPTFNLATGKQHKKKRATRRVKPK